MSSTTDRRGERGQVLAIFAFGIIGILAIAALVFDVGSNLFERRKHQDAADAAALAGARFLTTTNDSVSGQNCLAQSTKGACQQAVKAALAITSLHGYDPAMVDINIPPLSENSAFGGARGHIQVSIRSDRGSFFAGLLGQPSFRVAATAVAANNPSFPLPYSFLALHGVNCDKVKAGHLTGNGTLVVEGDVMVTSTCPSPGNLAFDGGNVYVDIDGVCGTSGVIDEGPSDTTSCGSEVEDAPGIDDPLAGLNPPVIGSSLVPNPPQAMEVTGSHAASNRPPAGCPGSTTPATQANPVGCDIHDNREKVVRIYPGVYWGGLKLRETSDPLTVYMEPGIYYMAGGGFEISGAAVVRTVPGPISGVPQTTFGGGVMIYNTDGPNCGATGPCIKAFDIQNSAGGEIRLRGIEGTKYDTLLLFQDRTASSQPAISIEGHGQTTYEGTIYVPKAEFKYTGLGGGEIFGAQVICDIFKVSGNGSLLVTYDPDDALQLPAVGLVQ